MIYYTALNIIVYYYYYYYYIYNVHIICVYVFNEVTRNTFEHRIIIMS